MTQQYAFSARMPFDDSEALRRVSAVLELPLVSGPRGQPEIRDDGLTVYSSELDDEDRRGMREDTLGLDPNVDLVFLDDSYLDEARMFRVVRRAAASFRDEPGVHGILYEDFTSDSLILEVDAGDVTLNSLWAGWREWPEVDGAVAQPYRMAPIRTIGSS